MSGRRWTSGGGLASSRRGLCSDTDTPPPCALRQTSASRVCREASRRTSDWTVDAAGRRRSLIRSRGGGAPSSRRLRMWSATRRRCSSSRSRYVRCGWEARHWCRAACQRRNALWSRHRSRPVMNVPGNGLSVSSRQSFAMNDSPHGRDVGRVDQLQLGASAPCHGGPLRRAAPDPNARSRRAAPAQTSRSAPRRRRQQAGADRRAAGRTRAGPGEPRSRPERVAAVPSTPG